MNHIKQPKLYIIFKYAIYFGLIIFVVFPLYWIVTTSIRTTPEIMNTNLSLIPQTFTLEHYKEAFLQVNLLQCLKNSLIITAITVVISIVAGIFMAYAFARRRFRGKSFLLFTVLSTQFIPVIAYIIPLFLIMSSLRVLNTYPALWITYLGIAFPVAVMLLINYIKDVPVDLEEAAWIDGCSPIGTLLHVVFPLAAPGIVSTAVYVFITIWQEYLIAVSFITKEGSYTASMALTKFQGAYGTDWGGLMAGAVSISIPVVILFLCSRKLFADTLTGGIKG